MASLSPVAKPSLTGETRRKEERREVGARERKLPASRSLFLRFPKALDSIPSLVAGPCFSPLKPLSPHLQVFPVCSQASPRAAGSVFTYFTGCRIRGAGAAAGSTGRFSGRGFHAFSRCSARAMLSLSHPSLLLLAQRGQGPPRLFLVFVWWK